MPITINTQAIHVRDGENYDQAILAFLTKDAVTPSLQTDAIAQLVEIADTYFNAAYDKSSQLVYASGKGIYSPSITDSNNVFATVCSQFAQACIAGISYQNSRYALGVNAENKPFWWGWQSDGTGTYSYDNDYMVTWNMAAYFDAKGKLKPFSAAHNGMKAGALAFFGTGSQIAEITHVGIILQATKDRYTMMHANNGHTRICDGKEAGVYVHESAYTTLTPTFYVDLADLNIPICETNTRLVAKKEFNKSGTYESGSTGYIGRFFFDDDPLPRGFYTINADIAGDSEIYVKVYYDATGADPGITVPNAYRHTQAQAGRMSAIIYAELPISRLEIRVENGTTFSVKTVDVFRGYHRPT